MITFLKSKYTPWLLVILAAGYIGYLFYGEHTKQKQEGTKQLAIEKPAEKKAEVVERVITRTITKEGKPIEIIKEVVKTVVEKTPYIPESKGRIRQFYVSGTYGRNLNEIWESSYGCAVGWNITDYLSTGLRFDTIGPKQRIAVEVRINF